MAHPQASSRSLEFFLDLGNLSGSVKGGTVVIPPNDEAQWEAQGEGTHIGWEWTVYNAGVTEISEEIAAAGSIYWDSVVLGLENGPEPLYGYKVSVRGYQDDTTATPIYGPAPEGGGPAPIIGYTYNNTRSYPLQTDVDLKFTNSQTRVPPLWPREPGFEGPGQAE